MYSMFLSTHKVVVLIFLFIYLVKTIFLLIPNKEEALDRITRAVKVPEMIISALMLITGIYLLLNTGQASTLLYIKITAVFVSIPLAVIGFKKKIKILAALSFLLILGAYGMAEIHKKRSSKIENLSISNEATPDELLTQAEHIYSTNCANCHGKDGKLGLSGAKDLSATVLTKEEQIEIIKNGKRAMPAYGKQLSDTQLEAMAEYISRFK